MKIAEFTKDVKAELRKVKWPTKKVAMKSLMATLVFSFLIVVYFVLADIGLLEFKNVFFNG